MATLTAAAVDLLLFENNNNNTSLTSVCAAPRSKRKLQKHLRSSGQAYISRTGKLIPAKRVAEDLCQCPQKCEERVPLELRERLFHHFYGLGDSDEQNAFLRQHMDVRARLNFAAQQQKSASTVSGDSSTNSTTSATDTLPGLLPTITTTTTGNNNGCGTGKSPRRITCKYLVPVLPMIGETIDVCQKAFVNAFVITTKRVRLQREKLISSMGLNSYGNNRHAKAASPSENLNQSQPIPLTQMAMKLHDLLQVKIPSQCDIERCTTSNKRSKAAIETAVKKCRRRLIDDPLIPLGLLVPDGVTIAPVTTPDHDRDIAIVNNFFSNQLWKPEYILGTTYS